MLVVVAIRVSGFNFEIFLLLKNNAGEWSLTHEKKLLCTSDPKFCGYESRRIVTETTNSCVGVSFFSLCNFATNECKT